MSWFDPDWKALKFVDIPELSLFYRRRKSDSRLKVCSVVLGALFKVTCSVSDPAHGRRDCRHRNDKVNLWVRFFVVSFCDFVRII